jgi:hypothetical protein
MVSGNGSPPGLTGGNDLPLEAGSTRIDTEAS